ncbi:MAG TPA: hypothetical protein VFE93_06975 [Myxococcaceae bacterium]|nr:hypothetical protein [Myxococcaceae bacterium]
MRKGSPVVACSIAALILVFAGAALVPSSAWRTASVLAHLGPMLVSTASGHGSTAVKAATLGVLAAPGLLREAPPTERQPAPQVRVCRRDLPRSCNRPVECPRQTLHRLRLLFPISG